MHLSFEPSVCLVRWIDIWFLYHMLICNLAYYCFQLLAVFNLLKPIWRNPAKLGLISFYEVFFITKYTVLFNNLNHFSLEMALHFFKCIQSFFHSLLNVSLWVYPEFSSTRNDLRSQVWFKIAGDALISQTVGCWMLIYRIHWASFSPSWGKKAWVNMVSSIDL